jgi:hypothetical protein
VICTKGWRFGKTRGAESPRNLAAKSETMSAIAWAKRWWQQSTGEEETPLDGDTPAWILSLLINLAVLLVMAFLVVPTPPRPAASIVIQQPAAEDDLFLEPQDLAVSIEPEANVGAASDDSLDVAESLAAVMAEEQTIPVDIPEMFADSAARVREPLDVIPAGLNVSESLVVLGDAAVGTDGANGAVDRLTMEINASLAERSTLVGWVFDQSVSLAGQRQEIAKRLEQVFGELEFAGAGRGPGLFHLVYAYGERVTPVIDTPVKEGHKVIRAIESIPVDESGIEMTFTAVQKMAERAKATRGSVRDRNVMLIVFTDEVGNDEQYADTVAKFCRDQSMRVFVVGVPAPFGRREVQIKFVEFDDKFSDDEVRWPVVDQGPETLHPEVVRIPVGGELDDPIDSGFGPFSLSKLCFQTSGFYLAVHANRGAVGRVRDRDTAPMASRLRFFFDPDVMRNYRPDYVPAAELDRQIAANGAKKALIEAAKESEVKLLEAPRMTFPREDDGKLAQLLGEAQKAAAVLQPKLDRLHMILAAGEPDRAKLKDKEQRWQAGYDLAMGRVLAHKVRTVGYNQMLAGAKGGKAFKDPKHDTWELVPSDDLGGLDSQTKKLADQARVYLRRVVDQHPGTPWALIADKELERQLGYAWQETFTDVKGRQRMAGGNNNGVPPDDAMRKLEKPKPKRQLKNI